MAQNPEARAEQRRLQGILLYTLFEYGRVGYDRREMTFLPSQFIGKGSTQSELYWNLRDDAGEWVLDIPQYSGITCTFRNEGINVWKGRDEGEQILCQLTPLPIRLDIGSVGKAAEYLGPGWPGADPFALDADIQATMWDLP